MARATRAGSCGPDSPEGLELAGHPGRPLAPSSHRMEARRLRLSRDPLDGKAGVEQWRHLPEGYQVRVVRR